MKPLATASNPRNATTRYLVLSHCLSRLRPVQLQHYLRSFLCSSPLLIPVRLRCPAAQAPIDIDHRFIVCVKCSPSPAPCLLHIHVLYRLWCSIVLFSNTKTSEKSPTPTTLRR